MLGTTKSCSVSDLRASNFLGTQQLLDSLQFHMFDVLKHGHTLVPYESPSQSFMFDSEMIGDILTATDLFDVLDNPIHYDSNIR